MTSLTTKLLALVPNSLFPVRGPSIEKAKNYLNDRLSLSQLLWRQITFYKLDYFLAVMTLVVTHWAQAELPFMGKSLADNMHSLSWSDAWPFLLIATLTLVFRTLSRLYFFFPARAMERDMRLELVKLLEKTPPPRYKNFSSGQLFQILSNDTEQMRALIGFALLQLANLVIALLILLPKLIAFEPRLVYSLLPLLISLVVFILLVNGTRGYQKKALELQGEMQGLILESYSAKKTIKHYHSDASFCQKFNVLNGLELKNFFYSAVGVALATPILPLGMGVALCHAGYIINELHLGASAFILFSGITFFLMEPLGFISWIGVVAAQSWASYKRITGLVESCQTTNEEERLLNLPEKFCLPVNRAQLPLVSLPLWGQQMTIDLSQFDYGTAIALLGPTGVGKSTWLYNLGLKLKSEGHQVAYVAQSPYLYNDTFITNLFLGKTPTESEKELAFKLTVLMGLDYLAPSKEELFQLNLGEQGKKLSGGQAKRVAMIRSLLLTAPILLWDDPLAAVDILLEKQILEGLREYGLLNGKLLLMSTHRLTTARQCDHYILLDKNFEKHEQGPIANLQNNQSRGYDFFSKQMEATLSV